MTEANHRLNVEVHTTTTSSGSFTDPIRNLKNLRGAALAAAQGFGPMAARINAAFDSIESASKKKASKLFTGISSGINKEAVKITSGMQTIRSASESTARSMAPMRTEILDSIRGMQSLDPTLKLTANLLSMLSRESTLTGEQIMGLSSQFDKVGALGSKWKNSIKQMTGELASASQQGTVTGETVKWLATQFNDLILKSVAVPRQLKQFVAAMEQGVPATQAQTERLLHLARVASTLRVPGFESISDSAKALIPKLETLKAAFINIKMPPSIKAFLTELEKGEPKTRAAAIRLRDLARTAGKEASPEFAALTTKIKAYVAQLTRLADAKGKKMPKEIDTVKKIVTGAAPTTSQAAGKMYKDLLMSLENMSPEYAEINAAIREEIANYEKLTGTLEEYTAEQRRNVSVDRGHVQHTREANKALMVTQSMSQGLMMGMGALQGSIMSVGFGLIFMRFSEIALTLTTAVLTMQLGLLVKVFVTLKKALIENGKLFLEQSFLARRLETDITKQAEAYPALARSAIVAGREVTDMYKTWETLATLGLASAKTQASAMDLAAWTGTSAAEAAGKMVELVNGEADALKAWMLTMGETDKAYINNTKAQWKLMTMQERMNVVMAETAKFAKGAGKEYANSFVALKQSIGEAVKYVTGNLGSPFVKHFINPILAAFRDMGLAAMDWVDKFMKSKTGEGLMKDLAKTGVMAAELIKSVLRGLGEVFKEVLPALIRFINIGLKILMVILTPLAKNIKLVTLAFMLLGGIITKIAITSIVSYIAKLAVLKTAFKTLQATRVVGFLKDIGLAMMHEASWGTNVLSKGLGGLKGAFEVLRGGISNLIVSVRSLSTTLLASPWFKIALVIGLIALVITKNQKAMESWQRVMASIQVIIGALSDLLADVVEILTGAFAPILEVLVRIVAAVLIPVLIIFANVLERIALAISWVEKKFKWLIPVLQMYLTILIAAKMALMAYAVKTAIATKVTNLLSMAHMRSLKLWIFNIKATISNTISLISNTAAKARNAIVTKVLNKEQWRLVAAWIASKVQLVAETLALMALHASVWLYTIAAKAAAAATFTWAHANKILGASLVATLGKLAIVLAIWYYFWQYALQLIRVIRQIWSAFQEGDSAITKIKLAIKLTLLPFITLINVVKQLWHWIVGKSPGLVPAFKQLTPIVIFFTRFIRALASAFTLLVTPMKWIVKIAKELVKPFKDAWSDISAAWRSAPSFFSGIWTGIQNAFSGVETWFGNLFANAWNTVTSAWSTAISWFSNIWQDIKSAFTGVVEFFSELFSSAWNAVTLVWSTAAGWFSGIWQDIKDIFTDVVNFFSGEDSIFSKAWNGIKDVWNGAKQFFVDVYGWVTSPFINIWNWFAGEPNGIFFKAWESIKQVWNNVTGFFTGVWDGIKKAFSAVADFFIGKPNGVFTKAYDGIVTLWNGLTGVFSLIWGAVETGFKGFVNVFIKGINFIIQALNAMPDVKAPEWLGGWSFGIPDIDEIKELQKGGITKPGSPIIAKIGEGREREVVSPISELSKYFTPRSDQAPIQITVNVTGNTIGNEEDANDLAETITRSITKAMSRSRPISTVGY